MSNFLKTACWSALFGIFSFLSTGHATAQEKPAADFVIISANIITVDSNKPTATCLAVIKDRIVEAGSKEDVQAFIGSKTKIFNAGGKTIVPGFIESHGHFYGLGQSLQNLDLSTAKSWDEIAQMVKKAAKKAKPGQWIIGRGWHQEKWTKKPKRNVEGYPVHEPISEVSPKNPVLLTHASGHMAFGNHLAMQLAGVSGSTPNPDGGEILRRQIKPGQQPEPIGIFRETAAGLLYRAQSIHSVKLKAEQRLALRAKILESATQHCLENGVTSFQDAGSSVSMVRTYRQLAKNGKLGLRLWVMVRDSNPMLDKNLKSLRCEGLGNHFLTVRGIKRAIDGALGAHGAWLLAPYSDLPTSAGLNTASIESIEQTAKLAIRDGYQLCIHAIGDRANREVLDLYQRNWEDEYGNEYEEKGKKLRWRIEHAQHLHPEDIPRFGKMGVIAAMQAIHCPSDAVYVLKRLGPRRAEQGAYVWRKLLDSGAIIANGTDTPVERLDPFASFHASVARRLSTGDVFFADQAMTRMEALKSYTLDAAHAGFEEKIKGSITPGKLADFIILSKDITKCPESEIRSTKILSTFLGGKQVFQSKEFKLKPLSRK